MDRWQRQWWWCLLSPKLDLHLDSGCKRAFGSLTTRELCRQPHRRLSSLVFDLHQKNRAAVLRRTLPPFFFGQILKIGQPWSWNFSSCQFVRFCWTSTSWTTSCCTNWRRRRRSRRRSLWLGCTQLPLLVVLVRLGVLQFFFGKLQVPKLQEFHSLQALHICDFFFSKVIDRSIRYLIYTPARSSSAEGCFPCRAFRALTSTGAWAQPTPHWEEEEGQGSGPSWTQWSRSWPWTPWKPWIVETALDEQWRTWKKKNCSFSCVALWVGGWVTPSFCLIHPCCRPWWKLQLGGADLALRRWQQMVSVDLLRSRSCHHNVFLSCLELRVCAACLLPKIWFQLSPPQLFRIQSLVVFGHACYKRAFEKHKAETI